MREGKGKGEGEEEERGGSGRGGRLRHGCWRDGRPCPAGQIYRGPDPCGVDAYANIVLLLLLLLLILVTVIRFSKP